MSPYICDKFHIRQDCLYKAYYTEVHSDYQSGWDSVATAAPGGE
jgi:hypothetical protein